MFEDPRIYLSQLKSITKTCSKIKDVNQLKIGDESTYQINNYPKYYEIDGYITFTDNIILYYYENIKNENLRTNPRGRITNYNYRVFHLPKPPEECGNFWDIDSEYQ